MTTLHEEAAEAGRQAAKSKATWVEMSPADAQSILTDVDPEVMDRYPGPSLSGEWADDPTPSSLYRDLSGMDPYDNPNQVEAVADAWVEAADTQWSDELQRIARETVAP